MPILLQRHGLQRDGVRRERVAVLPALTALRGPLAWMVVLFHFSDLHPFRDAIGNVWRPLLSNGLTAVDCFFVLSGFILFHVHSGLGRRPNWAETRQFLLFRLARIYPVHLVVLLAFVVGIRGLAVLTGIQPNEPVRFSTSAFFEHLLLLHGWGITGLLSWNYPSWSISSEWAAYLLAPGFFWLALRLSRRWLWVLIPLTLLALGLLVSGDGAPSLRLSLPRVWLGFLLGTLICRFRNLHEDRLWLWRRPALAGFWIGFILVLFIQQRGLLIMAFCGLMLFHGLPRRHDAAQAAPGWRMLIPRVLVYLGETSYAVYMGHALIEIVWLTLGRKLGLIAPDHLVLQAVILAVVIQGFAMLLHHGVEEPARKHLRHLGEASRFPAIQVLQGS